MWKVARSFTAAAVAAAGLVITYTPVSAQLPPCDFISGGGFVVSGGSEVNFGADGGCKKGAFWGHVNLVDHGEYLETTPYHVSSTEITGYFQHSNERHICGIAQTNADEPPVTFYVRMVHDESGTADSFGIRLSNGYHVPVSVLGDGGPGGGFIQLHQSNPSNTWPDPALDEATMCPGVLAPDDNGGGTDDRGIGID